jgi:hypothetical protein
VADRLAGLGRWARRVSRDASIPFSELSSLAAVARRTRRLRLAIALALLVALVVGAAVAPSQPGRHFLPANTVGIVVLDVSASITPSTYYRIEQELDTLAASGERFGLVLFSDGAYEALPPGTPSAELTPLLRFFAPPKGSSSGIPPSPWQQWFSGGTDISTGLFEAARMLQRDHVQHGSVVLISDLNDDPVDLGPLAGAVLYFQQMHTPLEIVGLNPTTANAEFFKNLLGAKAVIQTAKLPTTAQASGKLSLVATFPVGLAVATLVVILLLTMNEWWAEPLRWRPWRTA